eukprot:TRINITY_DN5815_c0_g1_i3.p2 TRINITY_DN5815_c0_g1~~TRINITY_DN5815_c0_g1_i3.p2  ORF type:complete len:109 (-),score=14.71 TRINITY_DN5815_c0_g1_i3:138-464(-)
MDFSPKSLTRPCTLESFSTPPKTYLIVKESQDGPVIKRKNQEYFTKLLLTPRKPKKQSFCDLDDEKQEQDVNYPLRGQFVRDFKLEDPDSPKPKSIVKRGEDIVLQSW